MFLELLTILTLYFIAEIIVCTIKKKKIVDSNSNSSNIILNLYSKSQSLFILKTSASLIQALVITDIIDIFSKHHDQDTTLLDAAI